jgi:hypothetical protein
MKYLLFTLLLAISFESFSQDSTDAKSVFKMWLFIDKENIYIRDSSKLVIKNDSLYTLFKISIDYKIDTLENKNFTRFGYEFYSISLNKCILLKELKYNDGQYLGMTSGLINTYIMCVNQKTGRSYRLFGFNGNDFLNFLSDVCEGFDSYPLSIAPILKKDFFNDYHIEGLDFKCLYDGLRAKKMDRKKYPCLKRCSDPISIH